mgnify:FL=1|tara:strand:+ start:102 stop:719 length:618 start_codon:yes stop_codon:yes gene_type:complete
MNVAQEEPMAVSVKRPELTMPQAEADLLRREYAAAEVILEYGAGGSTLVAAEMAEKQVFAVESDQGWIAMMRAWFAANPPLSPVTLHHGDIGPTVDWGRPKSESQWRKFLNYPLTIWDHPALVQPDLVLIDGRFRVGCFLATMMRITRPVTLLFDDYANRKAYHIVEEFQKPAECIGRMARFEVKPRQPDATEFGRWVALMQRPL